MNIDFWKQFDEECAEESAVDMRGAPHRPHVPSVEDQPAVLSRRYVSFLQE